MTFLITAGAVITAALAVYLIILVRQRLDVRAEARLRRCLIERERRLAELRMQQALQATVQRLFDAARERP